MRGKQSVGRNTISLMINPLFWGIVAIVTTGYIARGIGPEEFGKLSFALSFVNFFTLFTNLGFNNYLMKEFAEDKAKAEEQFVAIVVIRTLLALLTYVIGAIAINIMNYPQATKMIYYVTGLVIIPLYLTDSCEGVFKGRENMQFMASSRFIYNLISNISRCSIVYLGYKAYALAWNRVIVDTLGMCLSFYWVYKYLLAWKVRLPMNLIKKIIKGTLPFAFSTSFIVIYNRVDTIMLSYFSGDTSVAYYRAAFVLTENLTIITVAIAGAIYPAIARLIIKDKLKALELYNRSFFYIFIVSVPIAIGGFLLSTRVISLIFGSQYSGATPVLQVFFICVPLVFSTNIMGNVLMAIGQAKLFTYTMSGLIIVDIVADLLLIPPYAHTGAAFATLIAQSLNLILLIIVTSSKFGKINFGIKYFKILLAALLMGAILLIFQNLNIFILTFLGSATYFLAVWLFRPLPQEELLELKNMVLRRG